MTAVANRLIKVIMLIWLLFILAHGFAWFCIALAIGIPLAPVINSKIAARRGAERQRVGLLIRHADEEHRLVQDGRLAGFYGSHEPPPALWGTGMARWLI